MPVNIHQLLGRIPDTPEMQPIRLALEVLSDQVVTGAEVQEYITGTDFSFKTTTGSGGEEVVRIVPITGSEREQFIRTFEEIHTSPAPD